MLKLKSIALGIMFLTIASKATAQMTLEDLKAEVDSRSGNLAGFQELLDDPDPRRSLAAVEGMLNSGDRNLERMALTFALTNPDAAIRATALDHHFSKLPALAISFDGSDLSEEEMENFIAVLKSTDGSIGPNGIGSFNYQPAAYNEDKGCFPKASEERACAMRLGKGFVSVYFQGSQVSGRWVNFYADESGTLKGGANFDYAGRNAGSVPMSIRLLN